VKSFLTALFLNNRRFVLYCIIGLTGTTLDFCLYSALVKWTGMHYQIANAIGYASGTVLSFTLNVLLNFKTRDWLPLRFLSFCGVAFLGWASSAGILFVTVGRLGLDKYLAKLVTMVVAVLLQYNLNRLLSFRKPNPGEAKGIRPASTPKLSPE
jgi:putative flippase GtrA